MTVVSKTGQFDRVVYNNKVAISDDAESHILRCLNGMYQHSDSAKERFQTWEEANANDETRKLVAKLAVDDVVFKRQALRNQVHAQVMGNLRSVFEEELHKFDMKVAKIKATLEADPSLEDSLVIPTGLRVSLANCIHAFPEGTSVDGVEAYMKNISSKGVFKMGRDKKDNVPFIWFEGDSLAKLRASLKVVASTSESAPVAV